MKYYLIALGDTSHNDGLYLKDKYFSGRQRDKDFPGTGLIENAFMTSSRVFADSVLNDLRRDTDRKAHLVFVDIDTPQVLRREAYLEK